MTMINLHQVPTTAVPANVLTGGGWFGPSEADQSQPVEFVNAFSVNGFDVSYGSGQGWFVWAWPGTNPYRTVPYLDVSAWGLSESPLGGGGFHANGRYNESESDNLEISFFSVLNMKVQTAFEGGTTGVLHVIWGDWTSNTFVDCFLNITDITHNIAFLFHLHSEPIDKGRYFN